MKRIISTFLMTVLILTTLMPPALAASKEKSSQPTEGVMSSDPMYGSSDFLLDPNQVTAAGSLIINGSSSIRNMGNGMVDITGITTTGMSVSSIAITVYLQKWDGSKWVDITAFSNSAVNTNTVSISKNIAVSPGAYYRTRGVHTAQNGTITDTQYSTSAYIQVN